MPEVKISDYDQKLMNWYFSGSQLLCEGSITDLAGNTHAQSSITGIKDIDLYRRILTLQFRDGNVPLSFDDEIVKKLTEVKRI